MILLSLILIGCGKDPSMVIAGIESENPVVREDMVLIARGVEDPAVTGALIGALNDSSPTVRLRAVESLAELGATDAVGALVARLADEDQGVRRAAIDAIGRIGDESAVEPLLEYVERATVPPLNAIWALGNLGSTNAIPLLSTLRESENQYVAYNADTALRKLPAR
jgi:HEAT repeat protein